jgi:hypothetical protein
MDAHSHLFLMLYETCLGEWALDYTFATVSKLLHVLCCLLSKLLSPVNFGYFFPP